MFQGITLSETPLLTQMKPLKVLLLRQAHNRSQVCSGATSWRTRYRALCLLKTIAMLLGILLLPIAAQSNANVKAPLSPTPKSAPLTLQHQFTITLKPANNELIVRDTITLPDNGRSTFTFKLNSLFHLRYQNRPLHPVQTNGGVSSYHLAVDTSRQLTLKYKGKPESTAECSWLKETCVMMNQRGVFLDQGSHWYPDIDGALHRFSMEVVLPEKWVSLSQGAQTAKGWQEDKPQRSIYLLAGPFRVYTSQPDPARPEAMVYLQKDDPKLAQQYLQATHKYLNQYSRMLGAYPYAKFATVESFWETGWGMPSFTLLGAKVMRLPFILHSSFPHEILHNWWGNGVFVDSRNGNWSEGLTAYLADHLHKTSKEERVAYRRDALQKYRTFTAGGGDFPLRDFYSRHDRITQAVGYNKALMLFHMLRKQLGDQKFFASLKAFYRDYQFRFADFNALQQAFAAKSGHELDNIFRQWRDQTGAPQLEVASYQLRQIATGSIGPGRVNAPFKLELVLRQTQQGEPFSFTVPIKVQDNRGKYNHQTLQMNEAEQHFSLTLPPSAHRVLIDPDFDVLRLPGTHEVPAALNTLFNRQAKTFVLPHGTPTVMDKTWREFAVSFSYDQKNVSLQYDDEAIPENGTVVFLSAGSKPLQSLLEQSDIPLQLTETAYIVNGTAYPTKQHSLALTLQSGEQQIILLDVDTPEGLAVLARKLPHYGKYSYTLFNRATSRLVAKGQWEITESPMTIQLKAP